MSTQYEILLKFRLPSAPLLSLCVFRSSRSVSWTSPDSLPLFSSLGIFSTQLDKILAAVISSLPCFKSSPGSLSQDQVQALSQTRTSITGLPYFSSSVLPLPCLEPYILALAKPLWIAAHMLLQPLCCFCSRVPSAWSTFPSSNAYLPFNTQTGCSSSRKPYSAPARKGQIL